MFLNSYHTFIVITLAKILNLKQDLNWLLNGIVELYVRKFQTIRILKNDF